MKLHTDDPGLTIVRISARVYAKDPRLADRMIVAVRDRWNGTKPGIDGRRYQLQVTLVRADSPGGADVILIEDPKIDRARTSYASTSYPKDVIKVPMGEETAFAHEFGHLLGFADRYINRTNGGSVPIKGYEKDIMGDSSMEVHGYHLQFLATRP
jgi:hypothetical protein